MTRYSVKNPIAAIRYRPDGGLLHLTIPAGAVLCETLQDARTLLGMVGVQWDGRYFAVYRRDLMERAERVATG